MAALRGIEVQQRIGHPVERRDAELVEHETTTAVVGRAVHDEAPPDGTAECHFNRNDLSGPELLPAVRQAQRERHQRSRWLL